jgi:hypothetical protein
MAAVQVEERLVQPHRLVALAAVRLVGNKQHPLVHLVHQDKVTLVVIQDQLIKLAVVAVLVRLVKAVLAQVAVMVVAVVTAHQHTHQQHQQEIVDTTLAVAEVAVGVTKAKAAVLVELEAAAERTVQQQLV